VVYKGNVAFSVGCRSGV